MNVSILRPILKPSWTDSKDSSHLINQQQQPSIMDTNFADSSTIKYIYIRKITNIGTKKKTFSGPKAKMALPKKWPANSLSLTNLRSYLHSAHEERRQWRRRTDVLSTSTYNNTSASVYHCKSVIFAPLMQNKVETHWLVDLLWSAPPSSLSSSVAMVSSCSKSIFVYNTTQELRH